MEPADRVIQLLEEIRDLQKSWTEESRTRVAHSIALQEKAVRRQVLAMRLVAVIVIAVVACLVYLVVTR